MKARFVIFETRSPAWVESGRREYVDKLRPFFSSSFDVQAIKSPSAERDSAEVKRRKEGELLQKALDPKDLLILFDENGILAKNSEDFAGRQLKRVLESGKSSVVFCIGGAYGFTDDVKKRAQWLWALSPLTMNHWIAQLSALEQLYRGLTILKGIPYHNR